MLCSGSCVQCVSNLQTIHKLDLLKTEYPFLENSSAVLPLCNHSSNDNYADKD